MKPTSAPETVKETGLGYPTSAATPKIVVSGKGFRSCRDDGTGVFGCLLSRRDPTDTTPIPALHYPGPAQQLTHQSSRTTGAADAAAAGDAILPELSLDANPTSREPTILPKVTYVAQTVIDHRRQNECISCCSYLE